MVESEYLMIKCDLNELEENIFTRFLDGLKPTIDNVVHLQPY